MNRLGIGGRRFQKGQSGNPKGRPRGTANGGGPTVREIFRQVRLGNLDRIEQMLLRCLRTPQTTLKFCELDARLSRELGVPDGGGAVVITFNSPLSPATFAAPAGGGQHTHLVREVVPALPSRVAPDPAPERTEER
jgi:Family of unknown function (DUF5681)